MPLSNTTAHDGGLEFTCDDTVRQLTMDTPGGLITNTGTKSAVINTTALATPTRTQPTGAGTIFLPAGASTRLPFSCNVISYQDAVDANTTTLLYTRN